MENKEYLEQTEETEQPKTKEPVITYSNPRTKDILRYIDIDVFNDGIFVWPTSVSPNDEITKSIYERALAEEFGDIQIIESELPDLKVIARQYRDSFLIATDRMTVLDYTIADHRLTEAEREELIQVRDEFRRWPQSETFPDLTKMPDMGYWLFFEALYLGWDAPEELKALYGAV
ncbi:hypothetical protein [Thorsellia kenyensis]|uniref:ABC transporter substrate-binding protein n=1 Tax=Thorsellia kenyensis TaxID=1549888 RepID=A0ABV6C7T5_9GAMM